MISQEPDISKELMQEEKKKFLQQLHDQALQAEAIQDETIGQSCNLKWLEIRRNIITASNFGKICTMRATTSCVSTVKSLLYKTFTGNFFLIN